MKLVLQADLVTKVLLAPSAFLALSDPLARLASLELKALPERKVLLVLLDAPVTRDRLVLLARSGLPDLLVFLYVTFTFLSIQCN